LRDAMEAQKAVPLPASPADWEQLREQVETKMAIACGTAAATPAVGVGRPKVTIPREPPAWVDRQLDAQGSAGAPGGLLRAGKAAKAEALQQLRAKINDLPLTPKLSLGEAAKLDPRIEEAVARAVSGAQISKVEYDAPRRGQATATLSLDLSDLWRAIAALAE
jgi:hypothetical protein